VKLHNPFWCNEERTRSVVLQLIDAVAALHAQKVYHRDIKPENVLLSVDARTVYLSDFGSATSAQYTKQRVGTAEYSPPGKALLPTSFSPRTDSVLEQCAGKVYSSARADAWALAVTLFYLLTSELAWDCANSACPDYAFNMCRLRARTLDTDFPLSMEVQELLRDALQPEPEMRLDVAGMRARAEAIERFYPEPNELKLNAQAIAARMDYSAANWVERSTPPALPPRPTMSSDSVSSSDMHTFAASMDLAALLNTSETEDAPYDALSSSPTLSSSSLLCPSLSTSSDTSSDTSASPCSSRAANIDITDAVYGLIALAATKASNVDGDSNIVPMDPLSARTPRLGDFVCVTLSPATPAVHVPDNICVYDS
jgi:serine/threonine protein kinase